MVWPLLVVGGLGANWYAAKELDDVYWDPIRPVRNPRRYPIAPREGRGAKEKGQ